MSSVASMPRFRSFRPSRPTTRPQTPGRLLHRFRSLACTTRTSLPTTANSTFSALLTRRTSRRVSFVGSTIQEQTRGLLSRRSREGSSEGLASPRFLATNCALQAAFARWFGRNELLLLRPGTNEWDISLPSLPAPNDHLVGAVVGDDIPCRRRPQWQRQSNLHRGLQLQHRGGKLGASSADDHTAAAWRLRRH